VFLVGAGISLAIAYFVRARPGPAGERYALRFAAGAAVFFLLVGAGIVASRGNPLQSQEVAPTPGRLGESGLNSRWGWWKEAWHGLEGEPIGGVGAGSFELLHRKLRHSSVDVHEVHNLPLQFAAETGLVGLLLALGAAGAALLGAWRALFLGEDRAAVVALGVALPAFLVHGAFDYDWDFVAICGPVFFLTGFLVATGRPARRFSGGAWSVVGAAVVLLIVWAGLYSLAAPRLAAAKVDDAYAEIERGSLDEARDSARSAHSLDPLSIDPLEAWASAEEADPQRVTKARALYLQAVELQPLNWRAWYQLGLYDREVLGYTVSARRELLRALELDPHGCPVRRALGRPCQG
jgi:hypothetical protein